MVFKKTIVIISVLTGFSLIGSLVRAGDVFFVADEYDLRAFDTMIRESKYNRSADNSKGFLVRPERARKSNGENSIRVDTSIAAEARNLRNDHARAVRSRPQKAKKRDRRRKRDSSIQEEIKQIQEKRKQDDDDSSSD